MHVAQQISTWPLRFDRWRFGFFPRLGEFQRSMGLGEGQLGLGPIERVRPPPHVARVGAGIACVLRAGLAGERAADRLHAAASTAAACEPEASRRHCSTFTFSSRWQALSRSTSTLVQRVAPLHDPDHSTS